MKDNKRRQYLQTNTKQNKSQSEFQYLQALILNNFLEWEMAMYIKKCEDLKMSSLNDCNLSNQIDDKDNKIKEIKNSLILLESMISENESKKNKIKGIIQAEENETIKMKNELSQIEKHELDIIKNKSTIDSQINHAKSKLQIIQNEFSQLEIIKNEKEKVYHDKINIINDIIGKTLCLKPYIHSLCILRNPSQLLSIDNSRKHITIVNNDNNSQNMITDSISFAYIISVINNGYINTEMSQNENQYINNEMSSLFQVILNNNTNFFSIVYYTYDLRNLEVIEMFVKQLEMKFNFDLNIKGVSIDGNEFIKINDINYDIEYKGIIYTLSKDAQIKVFITCLFKGEIMKLNNFRSILNDMINCRKKKNKSKISFSHTNINNENILHTCLIELNKCCGTSPFHSYIVLDLNEDILLENINIINTISEK